MPLLRDSLAQRSGKPRFADARLPGNEHDAAIALLPRPQGANGETDPLTAPTEGVWPRTQRVEAAGDGVSRAPPPRLDRCAEALHFHRTERPAFEQASDQPVRAAGNQHRARL